jgi:hypothetical protein
MGIAALIAWLLTAAGGFYMLRVWISRGGHRRPGSSHLPPGVVFGHFGLAAIGLVLWIVHLLTGAVGLAWTALVVLVPVAAMGFGLLVRWIPTYRSARTAVPAAADSGGAPAGGEPAERHFPVAVVGAHGAFAVLTVVLVLLATLGAASG